MDRGCELGLSRNPFLIAQRAAKGARAHELRLTLVGTLLLFAFKRWWWHSLFSLRSNQAPFAIVPWQPIYRNV